MRPAFKIMPPQATPSHKVKQPAKDQWANNDVNACLNRFDLMQSDFATSVHESTKVNCEKSYSGYHRNEISVNRNGGTVDPDPEKRRLFSLIL